MRKVMTTREARIIQRLKTVAKMPITTIAKVTERHKKSIYNVIQGKAKFAKRGPKDKLSKKDITNLVKILRAMISKAKARYEITLSMLKKRAKCKVSDKVVRKALRTRKIAFRKMRSKPLLTCVIVARPLLILPPDARIGLVVPDLVALHAARRLGQCICH